MQRRMEGRLGLGDGHMMHRSRECLFHQDNEQIQEKSKCMFEVLAVSFRSRKGILAKGSYFGL